MGYMARRGHETAGVLYLVVTANPGRAHFFQSATNMDGAAVWRCPLGAEPVLEGDIAAWLEKEVRFDPDFWHLEIEGVDPRDLLDAPVDGPESADFDPRPSVAAADDVFKPRN